MKNLPIDINSRAIQCSTIGFAKNFNEGIIDNPEVKGYVRLKNISDSNAIFRYSSHKESDGIVLSPGETEYFYIEQDKTIEIVQGTLNIMF